MVKVSREDVLSAWKALLRVERKITELEKEKEECKNRLAFLIPQGGALYGVKHVRVERKNVAWKKVMEVVVQTLVPKTRHGDVEPIVEAATTTSAYSKFDLEEKKEKE